MSDPVKPELEYYRSKNDPLNPVYAVDRAAGTWELAASSIGVIPESRGQLPADGPGFSPDRFDRVWPKAESADGVVIFTLKDPAQG